MFPPADPSIHPCGPIPQINSEIQRHLALIIKRNQEIPTRWAALNNPTPTQLQNGPNCGLVALNLVGHHFAQDIPHKTPDVDVPRLLSSAQRSGFTTHGEMFSATNLASLAESSFPLTALPRLKFTPAEIYRHLSAGGLCLVPYDKDKDHSPCCLNGSKAHWAVIAGMVFPLEDGEAGWLQENAARLELENEVTLRHLSLEEAGRLEPSENELSKSFVIALHGKSRHQALWSMETLLKSNHNLEQASNELKEQGDYILPANLDGLKDHIIFVNKRL